MKRQKGWFTMSSEAEIEIDMDDIIENLDAFTDDEITELWEAVQDRINKRSGRPIYDSDLAIIPNNLYDEQKMEYIKKIYSLMTLDDLKKLLIKIE